ncbi:MULTISPECIES: hypothetical protein [unclassified Anabaena]|uniref:hypothetical protein n=1 Tax=unclassified Anabaena TaxID=2619674 RepID=UPI001445C49F|nr:MULTISPECIES: hypothetical protein [unclassified Anabaena]MTJ09958.1 hypothetical protein [Anabaena sp. UHCC 0204]MTJ53014.1 hypothetical protein [Anabaena sp. UHCC 0253]
MGLNLLLTFSLTRRSGQVIPLKDFNCRLAIYAEPHAAAEPPLLKPPLRVFQTINDPKPEIASLRSAPYG